MKLFKLDRRHTGYGLFSHAVDFTKSREHRFMNVIGGKFEPKLILSNFIDCRIWCWEQYGPGCEVWVASEDINHTVGWAWVNDTYARKIYFKDETIAGMFSLMWCK
jgi:hypothetical protein